MSNKKKGFLTLSKEWAQHLRPWGRRLFWGKHRAAEKREIREQVKEGR